ncbi:MAG: hypothetical protein JW874_11750 [Spirochaetales bacterium]|nr:hypothetical protein [Spirochaetales bacterium]
MTIKGKEPTLIIISIVFLVSVLSLLFFIRLDAWHRQRDRYTDLASQSCLASYMNRMETLFEQGSLLARRLEWEGLQALRTGSINYDDLSERIFTFQSVLPEELGFFMYMLEDDMVLSGFTGVRKSRNFFTSRFIFEDSDAYRWRNIQISLSPVTRMSEALHITLNGKEKLLLPLVHAVKNPLDMKNTPALICVYLDLECAEKTAPDFPLVQGGVLQISDTAGNVLYSFPGRRNPERKYRSIRYGTDDAERIYALLLPESLFSHRTTLSALFVIAQAVLYLVLAADVILGFYLYTRKRLRTIHGQFETFSKKGAAARFLDQVLIENSGIANSFVIRNHLERNYFIQQSIFTRPPGPKFFNSMAAQFDLDLQGKCFIPLRIQLHTITDSYRRRLRTLAIQEFLEQIRGADDIIFDEAPGITGMVLSAGTGEKLRQKQKKIIHAVKIKFKYISFFCGREHTSLLECLYFWFETSPGCFMKNLEARTWTFNRNDADMLYYYPSALEYALLNSIINGDGDATAYVCDLIHKENYTDRFTGDFDENILFRELDQTIQKIQINSAISAAPQADTRNVTFAKYRELFMRMASSALAGIDNPGDTESDT